MTARLLSDMIRPFLARKRLQGFYEKCLALAVKGMNLEAANDVAASGEKRALEHFARAMGNHNETLVVFDVGANVGDYSLAAATVLTACGLEHAIYAFEPAQETFRRLEENTSRSGSIRPFRQALGSTPAEQTLFSDHPTSGLASLYSRRLEPYGLTMSREERVAVSTVDHFCRDQGVRRIHLLKLDVEGHELRVLEGAREMIDRGAVDFIQFEFGATHIDSRTFLRDYFDLLGERYAFHRILRDGLRAIDRYSERLEIFGLANYLAVRKRG